jgi:gliding motility-associated protein GldL
MGVVYGVGAGVVIIGALFKILHLKGADIMLILGLGTEAAIFFISAIEPPAHEYEWELAYPELAMGEAKTSKGEKKSAVKSLDDMMSEAKIEQEMISRLGASFQSLSSNVEKLSTVGDAALATNEYAEQVKLAAGSVNQLNNSYANAIGAIEKLGQTGDVSQAYYEQVQQVTQKMTTLNSIYEMELQESQNHIHQLTSFMGNLSKTVANLSDTENSTLKMKEEFSKLSDNLSSLNNVYGNMLSAMQMRG